LIIASGKRNLITAKVLRISSIGRGVCNSKGVPGTGTSKLIVISSGFNFARSKINSNLCSRVSPIPIIPPVQSSSPASLAIFKVSILS